MSPSNPCRIKWWNIEIYLYKKDLTHKNLVFISLLLGDKPPSMTVQLYLEIQYSFLLYRTLKLSKRSCTFWQSHSMWMTVSFELLHKLHKLSNVRAVLYIMLFNAKICWVIWYCSYCSLELFVHLKKNFVVNFPL